MSTKNTTITAAAARSAAAYMNERVPYFLHKPDGMKDTSRTVTVNGKNYQVKYEENVMIPRFVAEILDQSRAQERRAQELVDKAEMRI